MSEDTDKHKVNEHRCYQSGTQLQFSTTLYAGMRGAGHPHVWGIAVCSRCYDRAPNITDTQV